ncbi:ABC transporter substrate-binding protein [Rubrimonas cliftonensis]|uniref:Peptide/nickel transport system substrate-binding protein n=1 Tax=Rubrimonas cliftonensis TaxID=89524 RepID=A0A1H4GG73_9RHOB|nr:ABC transporter substrate-binding protein [Rubrimonas cliftonensis]SEB08261.1 peptide/nickel transport system substrate-binding protein [Rubrimonas cliftonensis]
MKFALSHSSPRLCALALATLLAAPATAADFTIGVQSDPDVLDPAQGTSVAGRVIFAAMCDKLVDVTPESGLQPQLATNWTWSEDDLTLTLTLREGVKFHDGELMDADAVKFNLDRYRSDPISRRRNELSSVESVEVTGPATVAIHLNRPFAPLVAVLSDRSGMMMSPKAIAAAGEDIGLHPVCAGPFEFVERVSQDHIALKRFANYWNAEDVSLDSVTYRIIPDASVRLFNLRSGDLDMIERVTPSDIPSIEQDPDVRLIAGPSIAYDMITFNVAHGPAADNPIGRSAKVRKALELSLDREAINQVVYDGLFVPGNQHELNGTAYWDPAFPMPPRDIAKAKALLAEAGVENPSFTMMASNNATANQLSQVIKAMAAEAGFEIEILSLTPATWVADAEAGNFEANISIWSGRPDPDANITPWAACKGFLNRGRWCDEEFDRLLAEARGSTDPDFRKARYHEAMAIYLEAVPQIVLYHYKGLWGVRSGVQGFTPYADGLIRLTGVRVDE